MSTGNLTKKRHLELPSGKHATTSVKKANATSTTVYKTNIKRNLLSQMENTAVERGFIRPRGTTKLQPKPQKVYRLLFIEFHFMIIYIFFLHFSHFQSIANISAGKIVKKYRRSSKSIGFTRLSNITGTEESIINYDAFEVRP